MTDHWTIDKIVALAPDAASAQAGKQLCSPRKWVTLGRDEQSLWGECQGSGKDPYRVQIELAEPALKCNCPSRKIPCKHSLGLLFLLAQSPDSVPAGQRPAWVTEWLESRTKRAEQKQKKAQQAQEGKDAEPADPIAAARRVAQRQKKVEAGLSELDVWLADLVRQGLGSAQTQPYSFWEQMAARLVDAQTPGLARLVRDLGGLASSGDGWQDRMLHRLSQLHLLLEGHKRIESLPAEVQADIRGLVGWTINQDELLSQAGVQDTWCVLGQRVDVEDRLRVQRTWLRGQGTGRWALVLQFAHGAAGFETNLVPGILLQAELVFYPGASMRALLKSRHAEPQPLTQMPGHRTLTEALADFAAALAVFPWIERYPMALPEVVPVRAGEGWALYDCAGRSVPLARSFARGWELLAMGGGHPIGTFGEWDGRELLPLSALDADGFVALTS